MGALASGSNRDVVVLRIAEGGMGYIELIARSEGRFSRLFARKRLHPHFRVDPTFRAMFLDEARLAGMIRHPNVTAVLEIGDDEEGPFLLMDYVEGPSVAQILERVVPSQKLLPTALCVSVVAQAARGLHAAHQLRSADGTPLGVVHRDISPKNLLVGFDGLVRVADFGIAKANDNVEHTRVGVLKGNIGYMAPEYLRFQDLDCRSDLFALGVVLYELLTRERLYGGADTAQIARRIVDEPPLDIFEVRDVPPELSSLLFDLLAKDRELRPPDAHAVALQLDSIAAGLASIDGPFDIPGFLETELGQMRTECRAAIDVALSSAAVLAAAEDRTTLPSLASGSSARSGKGDGAPSRPQGGEHGRKRGWLLGGGALLAVMVVALPLALPRMRTSSPRFVFRPGDASLWAGGWHNCARRDERLVCWGNNIKGQLGEGTVDDRSTPVPVQIGPVRALALGEYHACALAPSGRVACWGRNVRGETGRVLTSPVKLPLEVEGLTAVVGIAAGRQHTCALLASGAVTCWGANESAQLGRPASEMESPAVVPDLPPAERIFGGGANTCAWLVGGGLRCWGANESGQLGDGPRTARATPAAVPGVDDVKALAIANNARAGSKKPDLTKIVSFMCALSKGGNVLCWGSNNTGQLGDGTREDRTMAGTVHGVEGAIDVAAGDLHACALLRSGAVSCWGRNEFGAIGDRTMGPSEVRVSAVAAFNVRDAVGIALGAAHTCARRQNGMVSCWGVNNYGQLGDPSVALWPAPHDISGFP